MMSEPDHRYDIDKVALYGAFFLPLKSVDIPICYQSWCTFYCRNFRFVIQTNA